MLFCFVLLCSGLFDQGFSKSTRVDLCVWRLGGCLYVVLWGAENCGAGIIGLWIGKTVLFRAQIGEVVWVGH